MGTLLALTDNLHEAVIKQAVFGLPEGRVMTSREQPLPYSESASAAMRVLLRWAYGRAWELGFVPDGNQLVHHALRHITRNAQQVAQRDDAADWILEAEALATQVEAAVDRPPETHSLGLCQCGRPIRVQDGDVWHVCGCGTAREVAAHRKALLREARGLLLTAQDMARVVSTLGTQVNANTIRKWAERKRLVARAKDPAGRPLYRVSDVLELISEQRAA